MTLASKLPTFLEGTDFQEQAVALEKASSLAQMVCIALQLGLLFARWLLEDDLSRRAVAPTVWPECRHCGHRLHSKGFQSRQMQTLVGVIY